VIPANAPDIHPIDPIPAMIRRLLPLALLLMLAAAGPAFAQRTLIHAGTLLDPGVSMSPMTERTIVVEGDRVTAVEAGYTPPGSGDTVIDLKNYFVTPGWIDSHTHLTSQSRKDGYMDALRQSAPFQALQAARYAETTLMTGFTTVRNVGGSDGVDFALRDAINAGLVRGPRMFVAEGLSVTGGHGDPTNGLREDLFGVPDVEHGVVDGVDTAMRGTRLGIKRGADLIKITATGGVLSVARDGSAPSFLEEEIAAIVEVARGYGLKVAAHAHGDEGMQRAVRAGVASIEHGTMMSEATMALMKERGTYLVPTIVAGRSTADSARIEGYYVPVVQAKALAIGPMIQATFAKAYRAGVPIAFGTDAGVFRHGRNAVEFEYMAEAGMPPMEIFRAATYNAADLLGQLDRLGTLEPGKYADLVALRRNPLQDIRAVHDVAFIMKGGEVVKGMTNDQ
jgi:imidazolonepropionase-like amidohydrolase